MRRSFLQLAQRPCPARLLAAPSSLTCASRSAKSSPSSSPSSLVNRAQLLLEVELALVLEQRAANVVVDLSLEPQQLAFAAEQHLDEHLQQLLERLGLEQLLSQLEPDRHVRRDAQRLPLFGLGALDDPTISGGMRRWRLDVLLERVHHPPAQRLGLGSSSAPGPRRRSGAATRAHERSADGCSA